MSDLIVLGYQARRRPRLGASSGLSRGVGLSDLTAALAPRAVTYPDE
jgi:hypothetical protein